MWFVWMLAMGFAGPPEGVSAVAAPHGVQAQYDAFRDQKGLPAQSLACTPLWPEQVALCFKVIDGQKRRWVVAEDLSAWGVQVDTLRSRVATEAASFVSAETEQVKIDGMSASYRQLRDGAGRAVLGLLAPEALVDQVGGPVMAAIPSTDVVLFWKAGDEKVDHVMAVGVREIHDASTRAVSPVVFRFEDGEWRAYAEATPTEAPKKESGPSIEEDPRKSGADGTRTHDL